MKSLKDYIKEGYNSPDNIKFVKNTETGVVIRTFGWDDYSARPFMYAIKQNKTIFGKITSTHADMFYTLKEKHPDVFKTLKLDTTKGAIDIRYDPDEYDYDDTVTYDKWVSKHKEVAEAIHSGRLWDVNLRDEYEGCEHALFIAWWDELTAKEFVDYNTTVIETYFRRDLNYYDKSTYVFYCVDNNGHVFDFDLKAEKNIEIDKRSKESKQLLSAAKAIHLATQEEKKKFYANFKKMRDEKNQKIYNHTKSKTEAEYRSLKYQESLEQ